jgi:mRNA-degrading endonuclease RelE of RelBE toxin-antitoxin system
MSFNIIATPRFRRELKRLVKKYSSLKNEFAYLIDNLGDNPKLGTPIGHDCYKVRLAIASKGKGKSGGARVITYVYVQETSIFLISIYDKSEKSNITDAELLILLNEIN